jgi:flagellar biosynthesis/type III secretory pathway protein FliH
MKLSNNSNSSQQVKSWLPEELKPVDLSSISDSPVNDQADSINAFFQSAGGSTAVIPPSGMTNRVVKTGESDSVVMSWMPNEFDQKPTQKTDPKWEPAIKAINSVLGSNPVDKTEQILKEARQKADEIIAQAQESAESITNEAMREGLESSQAEMHDLLQTLRTAVEDTFKWRDDVYAQSETMVLGLVKTISQSMFGEGFVLESDILQQNFNRVLENARSLGNLRIYVNPDDALKLGPAWREYQESISSQRIEIIPSGSILRGGCYVNGQWGSADGRVETQMKTILNTLTEGSDKETE